MNGKPDDLKLLEASSPESLLPESGFSQWWIIAGVALFVFIIIVILIVWKRRSPVSGMTNLRHAAYANALTEFSCTTASDVRDAAIQCSLILRKYLSVAAGDPALFETHEEFISRHDALQPLTGEARLAAANGFTRLATLKYAPDIPAEATAEEIIQQSRALLETLHHGFST